MNNNDTAVTQAYRIANDSLCHASPIPHEEPRSKFVCPGCGHLRLNAAYLDGDKRAGGRGGKEQRCEGRGSAPEVSNEDTVDNWEGTAGKIVSSEIEAAGFGKWYTSLGVVVDACTWLRKGLTQPATASVSCRAAGANADDGTEEDTAPTPDGNPSTESHYLSTCLNICAIFLIL